MLPWRIKRFERYILEEISGPFVGALAVIILFLVIVSLQEVFAPLLAKGASPGLVARLIALYIPMVLARGLPLALMFATLLGLSRLAADSEIKAALAGGLPISRLMRPVVALAIGVTLLAFLIGEGLRPKANTEALKVQQQIVFDNPRVIGLGEKTEDQQSLVLQDMLGRAISVGEAKPGGELRDLRIVTMVDGQPPREVITAESGFLRPGSNILELTNGQRVTYQFGRPVTVITFEKGTLPVQDVEASFSGDKKSGLGQMGPQNLSLPQLWARVKAFKEQKVRAPMDFTAFHLKFAEPLSALALGLFSVSLAIYTFRSGLNIGFTWALILAFVNYATGSVFKVMGEQGVLPPVLAAHGPNLLALLAAGLLLWHSNRR